MNFLTMPALAMSFKVLGAITTVPAVGLLSWCGVHYLARSLRKPLAESDFGKNPDALLLILKGFVETLSVMGRIGTFLEDMVFGIFTFVGMIGLVVGIACWFTGRGLHAQAGWARVSAFVLLLLAILSSASFALPANNVIRAALFGIVVVCFIALHTLWLGYSPQTH